MQKAEIEAIFKEHWRPNWGSVTVEDTLFIQERIAEARPERILEIGTATGLSAGLIARIMGETGGKVVTTVDYRDTFYGDTSKPAGFLIPEVAADVPVKVERVMNTLALDFSSKRGRPYEMAFIDANHQHPWPLLDTLAVFPRLTGPMRVLHHDLDLYQNQTPVRGIGPKYLWDQVPEARRCRSGPGGTTFEIDLSEGQAVLERIAIDAFHLPWSLLDPLAPAVVDKIRKHLARHFRPELGTAFEIAQERFLAGHAQRSPRTRPHYREVYLNELPRIAATEIAPLEGHIGKGPLTVLDVGANTGTWTKAWLDAFGDRTTSVHMFEPHSRNVKEIRRRIAEGFFDEIGVGWASKLRIVPQAVGAKSARAPLRFGLAEARVSSLAQATSRLMGLEASLGEVETVPVTTLDTYLASVDLPHINVLRIGTEGFELPVLQGAAAALRSGRIGTILFEFGMHQLASRHTLEDFWTLLEPLGYRFHRFGLGRRGWGLTPITEYRRGLEELHTINVFMAQRPPRTT